MGGRYGGKVWRPDLSHLCLWLACGQASAQFPLQELNGLQRFWPSCLIPHCPEERASHLPSITNSCPGSTGIHLPGHKPTWIHSWPEGLTLLGSAGEHPTRKVLLQDGVGSGGSEQPQSHVGDPLSSHSPDPMGSGWAGAVGFKHHADAALAHSVWRANLPWAPCPTLETGIPSTLPTSPGLPDTPV